MPIGLRARQSSHRRAASDPHSRPNSSSRLRDGIEFSLDGRLNVDTVFLFAEGVAANSEYRGSLPFGLTWGMTRDETEALLGTPDFRSEIMPDFDNTYTSVYRQIADQPFRSMGLWFNSSLELQEVDISTNA